ncbi:thiamine-phosphate kinase [Edaphobacter sp. HDX4]|uniref:thiamine-phosphate kinase n=1 Tax=Edaphobacter sp. HDX4 TaxID=2794064 RepID=UPI002FE53BA7
MFKKKAEPAGELALIEQIRRTFPVGRTNAVTLGIGDDCAILRPPDGHEVVVTTDFTLENRHFRRDLHPASSVGHRCLARGLSDIASMGAKPLAAFLSIALPGTMLTTARGRQWMAEFFAGMRSLARRHNTPLAGGDTSQSPDDLILADIILIGAAPPGRSLRRSGARAGDLLYVTGSLGGAHTELTALLKTKRRSQARSSEVHPHLFPQPRLSVGAYLLHHRLATAAIDLSDGLSTDLTHLCESSRVRAEVDAGALPLHPLTSRLDPQQAMHAALNGGEDYELLFAADHGTAIPRRIAGVPVTRIGTLLPRNARKPLLTLSTPDGSSVPLRAAGWEHFVS